MLACHNGDVHYFPRALASIKAQTIADQCELVIAFDGEADPASNAVFDRHPSKLPLSKDLVVHSPKSGYYTGPRNRALPFCRGAYIANLDVDNEWRPTHLEGLLSAIRTNTRRGLPSFTYSRREYVKDPTALEFEGHEKLPDGTSPFVPWERESAMRLVTSPNMNFVDSSDFLMSKGSYYRLGNLSGFPWNPDCRRFGDWDFIRRAAMLGFWGVAVDQATNVYHWTGANLQTTRWTSDLLAIPQGIYEKLEASGLLLPDTPYTDKPNGTSGRLKNDIN
jgi:glycosyltransferase involved in cell wall biosynthesis